MFSRYRDLTGAVGLIAEICQVGEIAYISIADVGALGGPQHGSRRWLLSLAGEVIVDVTPQASQPGNRIVLRLPVTALPRDENGTVRIDVAELDIDGSVLAIIVKTRRIDKPEAVEGNIVRLSADGTLIGWAFDPDNRQNNIPVEVSIGGRAFLAFTDRPWPTDGLRQFSVPLTMTLSSERPIRVEAYGPHAKRPFRRSPSFIMQTPAGWLMAAPLAVSDTMIEGAFLLAEHQGASASVMLRQPNGQVWTALCNQRGPYNFSGVACGFAIAVPGGSVARKMELNLSHPALRTPLRIAFDSLLGGTASAAASSMTLAP